MRILLALVSVLAGVAVAEEFPLKVAAEGRVQLIVSAETGPLVEVESSLGSVTKGVWLEDEAAQERLKDVTFPIDWWRWRELELGFTPTTDGVMELHLAGPWAEQSPGVIFRQEVLWDDVKGEGVRNGDFSEMDAWESPWRPYLVADAWPTKGLKVGAAWHGRPLVQKLKLTAGKRVVLTMKVRAATTPEFIEPVRLGKETAAHRANAKLKRGVNLGNGFEAPPGSWGIRYDEDDIDRIAAAGFDHVRVPVSWQHHITGDSGISTEFLKELEPVLKRALERRMRVLLNWHHFEALNEDPAAMKNEFVAGWRAIAKHFSDWPPELYLELLNEPSGALEGEMLNDLHSAAIEAIRQSNPERILMVNPGSWAATDGLGALRLPSGDEKIIVSFHCYDPFRFTHQGAAWVNLQEVKDVVFPGDLPMTFERRFDDAQAWSEHFGRPVHLGEFGAYETADLDSRKRYAKALRTAAEARGIPWCWWEWKAGFGCWDDEKNQPVLIRELMGK